MTDDVFEDLVNLYLDKEISPAQLQILRDELDRNPVRQNTFESYCKMHQATHFAALSASPVIPRLASSAGVSKQKSAFFAFNKQVWAAAVLIAVIGSFATVYFNGPFGSSRIERAQEKKLQKIDTFVQAPLERSEPPLEFFRALRAQNEVRDWSYVQELRHARANSGLPASQAIPSYYSWTDAESKSPSDKNDSQNFELEYSSYEFKR